MSLSSSFHRCYVGLKFGNFKEWPKKKISLFEFESELNYWLRLLCQTGHSPAQTSPLSVNYMERVYVTARKQMNNVGINC